MLSADCTWTLVLSWPANQCIHLVLSVSECLKITLHNNACGYWDMQLDWSSNKNLYPFQPFLFLIHSIFKFSIQPLVTEKTNFHGVVALAWFKRNVLMFWVSYDLKGRFWIKLWKFTVLPQCFSLSGIYEFIINFNTTKHFATCWI